MQPYNPDELDVDPATMAAFLGQTAKGLAEIDQNIIERSDNLHHKRGIFAETARNIMHTAVNRTPPRVMPQQQVPQQMHQAPPQYTQQQFIPQVQVEAPQNVQSGAVYNENVIIPTHSVPLIPVPQTTAPVHQQIPVVSQPDQLNLPFIDKGRAVPLVEGDPRQLEFDFNNSVTAITINNNIADLKKKILDLDKKVQLVLDYFHDVADSE